MYLRSKSKASYLYNIDTKLLLKIELDISSASASCWSDLCSREADWSVYCRFVVVLLHCFQSSNPRCLFHQDLCLNCAYVGQSSPAQLTPSTVTGTYRKVSLSWAAPSDRMCAATAAGTFSVHFYSFCRACQRRLSSKKTFRFVRHHSLVPVCREG